MKQLLIGALMLSGLYLLFYFYCCTDSSNAKTFWGKIKEALIRTLAHVLFLLETVVSFICESPKQRRTRRAKTKIELILSRLLLNGDNIYQFNTLSRRIQDNPADLNKALSTLELSQDIWENVAKKVYYIGAILDESYFNHFFHIPSDMPEACRKELLSTDIDYLTYRRGRLLEGLDFFRIDVEEWLKYGSEVLTMHNIFNDANLNRYGTFIETGVMNSDGSEDVLLTKYKKELDKVNNMETKSARLPSGVK